MPRKNNPPGPRSLLPGKVLYTFRKDPLAFMTRQADQFGPITHFAIPGQKYFILNDPELIRRVLVTEADGFIKSPALQRSKRILGEGLITSEDPLHKKQRKLIQPSFHAKWVETYADAMVRCTLRAADRLQPGTIVDVHDEMMRLTLIIAAETLFGAEIESRADLIGHAMDVILSGFNRAILPWGRLLQALPTATTRRIEKARTDLYATIDHLIAEARSIDFPVDGPRNPRSIDFPVDGPHRTLASRNDVLSRLITARDDDSNESMTDTQLRSECFTLLTAGHETTANLMTFTWYLLAQHPAIATRVRTEVDSVLSGRAPTAADANKFPFIRQVLSEVMRLYPPVWVLGRMPTRPFQAGPFIIPPKSAVLMSQWVLHRSEKYWPDPLTFNPDRWSPPSAAPAHRYAYFPFGSGPRNCIGDSFAWLEATLVLATLITRKTFSLCEQTHLTLQPTITLRPRHGLKMKVEP